MSGQWRKQPTPRTIDNITTKTDSEDRYCLNDLHKAAGGIKKSSSEGQNFLALFPPAGGYRTKVNRTHLGMALGKPMEIISESGLYKLIMRSDKPEARAFHDWVTKVVLPAIRKDQKVLLASHPRTTQSDMDH